MLLSKQSKEERVARVATSDDDLRQEISDQIERRWAGYFPSRPGATSPKVVCHRTRPHGFSVLFEYEVKSAGIGSKHVIAKVRRDSRFGPYRGPEVTRAPQLLRLEFEELSRAYQHFQDLNAGLGVVRPFDYLEELNTVLIEKASGRDLGLLLDQFDDASLVTAFTQCGQWLRAFHQDIHQESTRVWTKAEFEPRLIKRCQTLLGQGVPTARLDALLSLAANVPLGSKLHEVPHSVLHGDYKLRHVWASGGSIQVLDFGNVHAGDCYVDVAYFLVELSVLRLGSPWFDSRKANRYSRAFLNGYFTTEPPPLVGFYVVEALLKKWIRRLRSWSRTTMATRFQTCAKKVGVAPLVERVYIDRWFDARIREALAGVVVSGH